MEIESPISRTQGRPGMFFTGESGRCFPSALQGVARQESRQKTIKRGMKNKVRFFAAESKKQYPTRFFDERNFGARWYLTIL
jgi:hypothetical protein